MKIPLSIVLSAVVLCACSPKQDAPGTMDIEEIQPGKKISLREGHTLRVTKRDGNSLEGVTITAKLPNGQTQTLTAESATLSVSSNAAENSLTITLHNAKTQVGSETATVGEFPIHLSK